MHWQYELGKGRALTKTLWERQDHLEQPLDLSLVSTILASFGEVRQYEDFYSIFEGTFRRFLGRL